MVGRRRRFLGSLLVASLSAGLVGASLASPVLACTSEAAPVPLATLVREAHAIVVTSDVKQADDGALSVGHDRVLKAQDAPERYEIPWQGTCPYPWGVPTGHQRALLLIADGAAGPIVTDLWIADRNGRLLTPLHHDEVPPRIRTLGALLAYVMAGASPDTATEDPVPPSATDAPPAVGLVAILSGILAGLWMVGHPRRRRPPGDASR
jgi:hypothetical protein